MTKKILVDAVHPEETRVVLIDKGRVEKFEFSSRSKQQITGNIYLAQVIRIEPSLQAAFVEYGGNRHGFLPFSEIHPDYYHLSDAEREAINAENERREKKRRAALANVAANDIETQLGDSDDSQASKPKIRHRRRSRSRPSAEVAHDPLHVIDRLEDPRGGMADSAASDDLSASFLPGVTQVKNVQSLAENVGVEDSSLIVASDAVFVSNINESGDVVIPAISDDNALDEPDFVDTVDADKDDSAFASVHRKYQIQDVIKRRQILLIQVSKEERGNKGAALTTYISLAGRYCVLMPNTPKGSGISRKITNVSDRKKLKDIANDIHIPSGMGLIFRTAGADRSPLEIKRDFEYLLRQWSAIRELSFQSTAPSFIYEEGSIIKKTIRDLSTNDLDSIQIEGHEAYQEAVDFMNLLMPGQTEFIKLFEEKAPIFIHHQVESQLAALYNPVVQLKSGGYIVINPTEALIAIDVNSGRSTGEQTIEETALNTNLEAADEVARQISLRDLAGLIVIDFIDMEEPRNNRAVEKRVKDKVATDRARTLVGKISSFGLLEMSRQRLGPNIHELSTVCCPQCSGTGFVRTDESMTLDILRELERRCLVDSCAYFELRAPTSLANYLFNAKRFHLARIEQTYGVSVDVLGDPAMQSPHFDIVAVRAEHSHGLDSGHSFIQVDSFFESDRLNSPDQGTSSVSQRSSKHHRHEEQQETLPQTDDVLPSLVDDDGAAKRRRGRRGGRRRRRQDGDDQGSSVFHQQVEEAGQVISSDVVEPAHSAEQSGDVAETEDEKPRKKLWWGLTRLKKNSKEL